MDAMQRKEAMAYADKIKSRGKEKLEALREVEKKEAREQFMKAQREKDARAVLSTPEGRRMIRRILSPEMAAFYGKVFDKDPSKNAFNDGKYSVGFDLTHALSKDLKEDVFQTLYKHKQGDENGWRA